MTGLGVVMAMALCGLVFALAPRQLGLAPASITSDALLSMASSLWIWGVLGLIIELVKLKTFRTNLKERGWGFLFITAAFLSLSVGLFVGANLVELPSWLEMAVKITSLVIALPAALFVAATLDEFFLKPRLRRGGTQASRQPRDQRTQSRSERNEVLGGIGTVVAWILANVANLLTILSQLLGS